MWLAKMLSEGGSTKSGKRISHKTSVILAFVPIVVLTGMLIFLLSPYGQSLINIGTPLPQVTIEKIEFHNNQILVFIRNTGPMDIVISQADVNDRIQGDYSKGSVFIITLPVFSKDKSVLD